MTDLIDEEMNKYTEEKAEAAAFHGDRILRSDEKPPAPYHVPGW